MTLTKNPKSQRATATSAQPQPPVHLPILAGIDDSSARQTRREPKQLSSPLATLEAIANAARIDTQDKDASIGNQKIEVVVFPISNWVQFPNANTH